MNSRTPNKKANGALQAPVGSKCCFCFDDSSDDYRMGQLYTLGPGKCFHHFCLGGEDEEGILGFLEADIMKEVSRGKRLPCAFCNVKGATVGCSMKRCKRTYHMPCGLDNNSQFSFLDNFATLCSDHRSVQPQPERDADCPICLESVEGFSTLWAPCCKKDCWFHRSCIQSLALSAGYFFKCPLCNDKNIFVKTMQEFGTYVPEQDASWELEPDAYQELLQRPVSCEAPICLCSSGRQHNKEDSPYELSYCQLCGASAIHSRCKALLGTHEEADWHCTECVSMLAESARRQRAQAREQQRVKNERQEENSAPLQLVSDYSNDSCDEKMSLASKDDDDDVGSFTGFHLDAAIDVSSLSAHSSRMTENQTASFMLPSDSSDTLDNEVLPASKRKRMSSLSAQEQLTSRPQTTAARMDVNFSSPETRRNVEDCSVDCPASPSSDVKKDKEEILPVPCDSDPLLKISRETSRSDEFDRNASAFLLEGKPSEETASRLLDRTNVKMPKEHCSLPDSLQCRQSKVAKENISGCSEPSSSEVSYKFKRKYLRHRDLHKTKQVSITNFFEKRTS